MTEIIISPNGLPSASGPGGTFAFLAAPTRPTFEAVRKLSPLFARANSIRHFPIDSRTSVTELTRWRGDVWDRLEWLPGSQLLEQAADLFHTAEHVSASTDWLLAALSCMLAERTNAKGVSEEYVAALVDSMLYDADLHDGYDPGFSAAVVVAAIRELRRVGDFVPSTAAFLQACVAHRSRFKQYFIDAGRLVNFRENAEWLLVLLGEAPTDEWSAAGDFGEVAGRDQAG